MKNEDSGKKVRSGILKLPGIAVLAKSIAILEKQCFKLN